MLCGINEIAIFAICTKQIWKYLSAHFGWSCHSLQVPRLGWASCWNWKSNDFLANDSPQGPQIGPESKFIFPQDDRKIECGKDVLSNRGYQPRAMSNVPWAATLELRIFGIVQSQFFRFFCLSSVCVEVTTCCNYMWSLHAAFHVHVIMLGLRTVWKFNSTSIL